MSGLRVGLLPVPSIRHGSENQDAEWPVHPHTRTDEAWAHSDFKDVAIQHVYPLYEEMIKIGGLDEDDNPQDNE